MTITFTAYGIPAPKGSTKAFYRPGMRFPVVTEDCKRTRPWAAIVKDAAIWSLSGGPGGQVPFPSGGVELIAQFYMPRPKSLPKRVTEHTKKPDLDKLIRALKDALTGVIWTDDSQVVEIHATKFYVRENSMPCVMVDVQTAKEKREEIKPVEYPVPEERVLFT